MHDLDRAGRLVGALTLAQIADGVLVNLVLTAPLSGEPGFLVNAAAHSAQIAASVLVALLLGLISLVVAVMMFAPLRQRAGALAITLVAVSASSLAVAAVEQTTVMSMLSLSQAYAQAAAAERESIQGQRLLVASARNAAHYINLIVGGLMLLVFHLALYRSALVPRVLAAFGIAAALLQMAAVAMPLFGREIVFLMLAPVGLVQLVLGLWLLARGFRQSPDAGSSRSV